MSVTCIFVSEAVLILAIRAGRQEHLPIFRCTGFGRVFLMTPRNGPRNIPLFLAAAASAERRRRAGVCAPPRLPYMRRTIPDPHSLAPDAIMKSAQSDTVLEAANMAQMVGVLQQLGWLATYSHELFTDLTIEAEGSLTRINQLKGRLGRVTERLARVDDALAAASETEIANICAANPGGAAW